MEKERRVIGSERERGRERTEEEQISPCDGNFFQERERTTKRVRRGEGKEGENKRERGKKRRENSSRRENFLHESGKERELLAMEKFPSRGGRRERKEEEREILATKNFPSQEREGERKEARDGIPVARENVGDREECGRQRKRERNKREKSLGERQMVGRERERFSLLFSFFLYSTFLY